MFTVNEDRSIYATRGDIVFFEVSAADTLTGVNHKFQAGDVLRIKVFGKKDAETVVMQKDFPVTDVCEKVEIFLGEEDTKIGEVISKPKDYWYEVELNPYDNPQTIIGYDEDGPKVFKLFPEGDDIPEWTPEPEDIPVVDEELDMASTRPVQNQAVARAFRNLEAGYEKVYEAVAEKFVTPQMFGAIGDGVADDTEAVEDAVVYAVANGKTLTIPSGEYLISKTIALDGVQEMVCTGLLVYSGNDVAVSAKGNQNANLQIRVKNLDNRHVGTGIKLVNLYHCDVDLYACGFDIGCEFLGDGTGCVYNTFKPRYIFSNKVALKLNSANSGWCNQNVFFGGRIGKFSTDTFDLTGVLITSECGYYSNSNVFYGVSIEGKALHVIHAEYGQYNRFHEIRNEGCTNTLTEENESMCNTVIVSYGSNDVHNNNGVYIGSSVESFRNRYLPKYRQVFNCEEVVKKVYHTSNRVTSSVFKIMAYEGAQDIVSSANLDVSGDYIHSAGFPCLALRLDPTVGNRYYVEITCKENYFGRFAIVAYDKTGGFITTMPIKPRVHEGMARVDASGLTYFQTQADGKPSIEFEVTDSNVGKLYIFFKGGTDDLYIRGVTVFATGEGRVINDAVPQLNGIPTNAGCYGDMVKSSTDENVAWVMLDKWREIAL